VNFPNHFSKEEFISKISAQTEVMAWGNMTGIRVEGQLMEFESDIRVINKGWTGINATGKERQSPQYHRDGQTQIVKTVIDKIRFEQIVEDKDKGTAEVSITFVSDTAIKAEGIYFCVNLPNKQYAQGTVRIGNSAVTLSGLNETASKSSSGSKITVESLDQKLQLNFASSVTAFVKKETENTTTLYVQLVKSNVRKGQKGKLNFTVHATGNIDNTPAEISLDTKNPGRLFMGLGGNFRLQNPRVDPQIIDYCLDNLRVSWGRVELPWRSWQPEENSDPIADARAGKLDARVENAMKMAQRLSAKGIQVIVSCWFPPAWAIDGDPKQYVRRGGVQAYRLDPLKQKQIYKSLTDYLVYLKQEYGVEAVAYSFNESDLGIDVLHTAQEHADFIKGMGAYMASRGLSTKMLLGDNSDATTFDFILAGLNDSETHKYISAVSFHSWRGCDDETLHKWAEASRKLNVPLIVGEGSTDAAAHRYPEIFAESTFAFYEINLYTRICAICQPISIVQWQLTSDYSILWGNGVYGSEGPLRPTQRYWNLKQLASTPEESYAIPVVCSKEEVNCAAYGNIAKGEYAIHLVNNGAARQATIKGLPNAVSKMNVYVTNSTKGMECIGEIDVNNGTIVTDLPAISFITLIGK
jgi:O-glycosyl hydrolase